MSSQPRPPSEARRKIENARRKLLGENPAAIMIDDIAQVLAGGTHRIDQRKRTGCLNYRSERRPDAVRHAGVIEPVLQCNEKWGCLA